MTRAVTQILLGLMLLFGTITLLPKGIIFLKFRNRQKGTLYVFLAFLCAFFCVLAFHFAYLALKEMRG